MAGVGGGGGKRQKDAAAELRSARQKLLRASWDIVAAVGTTGGKRADRLTVPELGTLADHRGWSLPRGQKRNQANLLALCMAKRKEYRAAAAAVAGRPGDPDSDDGLDECWMVTPADYAPAPLAAEEGEQMEDEDGQQEVAMEGVEGEAGVEAEGAAGVEGESEEEEEEEQGVSGNEAYLAVQVGEEAGDGALTSEGEEESEGEGEERDGGAESDSGAEDGADAPQAGPSGPGGSDSDGLSE